MVTVKYVAQGTGAFAWRYYKKQRFVLGQQVETSALTCLRLIIRDEQREKVGDKLAKLEALNTELEMLRSMLRIACELKFLTAKSLRYLSR